VRPPRPWRKSLRRPVSFSHSPGYVGHQLFQIFFGGLKLRRLCVHFHLSIRRRFVRKGLTPVVFRPKVNSF
jgi:hypothetical protein